MRSRDEASSASTSDLRRVGPRAHAPRRPREGPQAAPAPVLELDDTMTLESVAAPEQTQVVPRLRGLLVGIDALAIAMSWLLAVGVPAALDGAGAQELTGYLTVSAIGL